MLDNCNIKFQRMERDLIVFKKFARRENSSRRID